MGRTIFEQLDATQVSAKHARVVEQLLAKFADAAGMLIDAGADGQGSDDRHRRRGRRRSGHQTRSSQK